NSTSAGGNLFINGLLSTNATIRRSSFFHGYTNSSGGGIALSQMENVEIDQCTFYNNAAYFGGGLWVDYTDKVRVFNTTFVGNTAGHDGGGMSFAETGDVEIDQCTFTNNIASYGGGGLFGYASYKEVIFTASAFVNNTAAYGGGTYFYDTKDVKIDQCTFHKNSASSGGGFFAFNSSTFLVTTSTFSNNTADVSGGAGLLNATDSLDFANNTAGFNKATYCNDFFDELSDECLDIDGAIAEEVIPLS
ncbi:MAG: right-handed parallel beta-helix repeat-containing protein, partial [Gaiellaceae bacterium]